MNEYTPLDFVNDATLFDYLKFTLFVPILICPYLLQIIFVLLDSKFFGFADFLYNVTFLLILVFILNGYTTLFSSKEFIDAATPYHPKIRIAYLFLLSTCMVHFVGSALYLGLVCLNKLHHSESGAIAYMDEIVTFMFILKCFNVLLIIVHGISVFALFRYIYEARRTMY
jgi:hypothetical protein